MTAAPTESGLEEVPLLIDGARIPAADAQMYQSYSPSTEAAAALVAASTPRDVDLAVAAARKAFDGWHRTSFVERRRSVPCT